MTNLLRQVEFILVPVINPDGYEVSSACSYLGLAILHCAMSMMWWNSIPGQITGCGVRTEG